MPSKKKSKTPTPTAKPTATKPNREAKPKKMSVLDAAAAVLKQSREPMNCQQMIEKMLSQRLWSTSGKTPAATLSSALLREITKGKQSRFQKKDRGLFALV